MQTVKRIIPRATIAVRLDIPTFETISDMAERNGLRLSAQARELLTEVVRNSEQKQETEVKAR